MFHPTRDGCRGGRDKFNWEELKGNKTRMNYLGNSLCVPARGIKELFWYAKDRQGSSNDTKKTALQRELQEQKEMEAKAMSFYLQKGLGTKLPEEALTPLDTGKMTNVKSEKLKKERKRGDRPEGSATPVRSSPKRKQRRKDHSDKK